MSTRREMLRWLSVVAPGALLGALVRREALAAAARIEALRFLRGIGQASRALRAGELAPAQWQDRAEELARSLDLADLRRAIDFDRLARTLELPDVVSGDKVLRAPGGPYRFAAKLFGLRRGRAITPHGHRNMVSMHTVLEGELRVRQFDRVRDEPGHLVLRPTVDEVAGPGHASSISSARNNVHWFVAQSETAFAFDCIVSGLQPLGYDYGIDLLDPAHAERLGDGTLRARRIEWDESVRLYGKS